MALIVLIFLAAGFLAALPFARITNLNYG